MSSGSRKKEQFLFSILSLMYMVASVFVINTATQLFIDREISNEKEDIRQNLALVRSNLEAAIFMDIYIADSLATVVTIDPDFTIKNWSTIADKLLEKARYIRNIAIAPDNVISHVYPIIGNESAIGFNYRTNPEQLKSLMLAKKLQNVYIAGPVELIQGGVGIIARYPIFSDYPINRNYWGSLGVVMSYERLLNDTGLTNFQGAKIALQKQAIDGTARRIFYGNETIFDDPDIEYPVNLPSGKWLLAANFSLKNVENIQYKEVIVRSIGSLTALLLYFLVALLYKNYLYAHKDSLHDELTRLPNRRFIITLLNRLMATTDSKPPFTLLFIDLNGFKLVNDHLGHEAGDELLKYVANRLAETVRSSDEVARFGGDEFMVILQGAYKPEQVAQIVTKIYQSVESSTFVWQGNQIQPSLSIG